jgi:predicted nucleic acid-binding protein
MRIFLDANILFSAAKSEGAIRRLLTLLADAGHQLCADAYVIEEARRNLAAKAPDRTAELRTILRAVELIAIPQASEIRLPEFRQLPEKDTPVLAAAIRSGCPALVTGDRTHFGPLYGKTIRGVTIHSPRSLAEKLNL